MRVKYSLARWLVVAATLSALGASACSLPIDQAQGCSSESAKDKLTGWAGDSGGVVRAKVELSGKQLVLDDHGLTLVYSELQVTNPILIAGKNPSTTTGWIPGGKGADGKYVPLRGPDGSLWGRDGSAVLVINPFDTLQGNLDKIAVHITPVVGDKVVLSNAGCWGFDELASVPFSGRLSEVPGSETADSMRGAMGASSYADFVELAKSILG